MLDLSRLADRHVRHGWLRTIHSAQGATADRVMPHLESYRASAVGVPSVYIPISRAATASRSIPTDGAALIDALGLRNVAQLGALDETVRRSCRAGT